MTRFGRRHGWWLIALVALLVVSALDAGGQLRALENAAADARAGLLRHEVMSDIVVIGIDSRSIQALNNWPWPRRQ